MNSKKYEEDVGRFKKDLESEMLLLYGPVMNGRDLQRSLGFSSKEAFRQAVVRDNLKVPVFSIEHRRGKFALTKEVAQFLAERRMRIEV